MNKSLQSYTPIAHPLNYDSLENREGCEADSGNDYFGALAFNTLCVFSHEAGSEIFEQPDTVSYNVGPVETGEPLPLPHRTMWASWVAKDGIRLAQVNSIVPPANTVGQLSSLFPTGTFTKVTHAFDSNGLLYLAVQRDSTSIRLKRYVDATGYATDAVFTGYSPMLVNVANLDPGDDAGVAIYYLRTDAKFKLFARFSNDNFAMENVVMPNLRVSLARLIRAEEISNKLRIYARDAAGRDVTLTSPAYLTRISIKASTAVQFDSGVLIQSTSVVSPNPQDAQKNDIRFVSGAMYKSLVTSLSIPLSKGKLGVVMEGGEMVEIIK